MNKFAHIKPLFRYNKVSYYSVALESEPLCLFEQFINKHTVENKEKLNHILAWLKIIGEKYGAQQHLFRNEAEDADTSALPPTGAAREPSYVENGKKKSNSLRLYTFRANEKVVFLFNGDIKTSAKAQNCPYVAPHFKIANQITRVIDQAFREKEIKWSENYSTILFDKNLKLQYSN